MVTCGRSSGLMLVSVSQVIGLVLGSPQPDHLRVFDDRVQNHQTMDRMVQRHPATESALRGANGSVERSLVDVIDPRAVVAAVVHRGAPKPHQLVEELPRLPSVDDAAEARVLAWHADAAVQHHGRQESSLTLGEALPRDSMNTFVESQRPPKPEGRRWVRNSSM